MQMQGFLFSDLFCLNAGLPKMLFANFFALKRLKLFFCYF